MKKPHPIIYEAQTIQSNIALPRQSVAALIIESTQSSAGYKQK